MSQQRAFSEMIFAAALWGFGFIATIWALQVFTPSETLLLRFFIATLAGLILAFTRGDMKGDVAGDFRRSLPAGLLLGACMWTQTLGLETTTAAKSGFLTTTYVIIVPFLEAVVLRRTLRRGTALSALIAIVGIGFLVQLRSAVLVPGDLWTLGCAFFAALHILYIDRVSRHLHAPFRFNTFQSFWCGLAMIPLLLAQDHVHLWTDRALPWAGILFLALASSVIGFTIQIRAQKVLDPATASVLFLLESPFALLFGILFLSEGFSVVQCVGAALIFIATWRVARASTAVNP